MAGGGSTVKEMTKSFGKLDKFQGQDFRRWQKKIHFMLTTLKVVYVLSTPIPELEEDETVENLRRRSKWENDDYICRGHILNGMSDPLFDIYQNVESAKELWDCLEAKYMAEDSSSKKFLVTDFKNYKMVESSHLRIEESLRAHEDNKGKGKEIVGPSVNMIEEGGKNDNNKNKGKKRAFNNKKGNFGVNKKPKLECWKCGRTGHFKKDCRSGKKHDNANANGSGKGSKDQSENQGQKSICDLNSLIKHSVSLTSEAFYVQDDAIAWWIDSGATTHVCKDRFWFKTFVPVEDGSILYMEDDNFTPVEGKGNVVLEFSFGKTITLFIESFMRLRDLIHLNKMVWLKGKIEFLKKWAVVRLPDPKRKTLGEKGVACIFVGYAEHSKAYRPKISIPNSDESLRDDHSYDVPSETLEPRRSKRARKSRSYGSDFQLYLVEGSKDQNETQYYYCYSIEEDPRTYDEAVKSRDSIFWKEAIDEEIGSIMENNTWFKARLVIQGFRQKEGIDYFDTYAPVARITTIRLLIALAAIHNLVIHQMDVKTAFLNGDLEEEVYMKQPEGFVMPGNEHKVCKLVKSLYGLKQAPKQWDQKYDEVVLSNGFILNQADKCVYSIFDSSGKGVFICLYVDDMLIFGTNQNQVDKTKNFLSSKFSMKDMGEVDVILVSTPMDPGEKLMPNTGKPVDQLEYSRAIGSLMYAMISTRPDIAYAVGKLSRFTSNPSRHHWHAITRVFKYLKGTMNYGLSYMGFPSVLEGYSDASWINYVEDSSSTSGWVFLLGGGAISWASKKQTCITSSTMESEFVALSAAGKEAEWLRNLVYEIPIWPKPISPISIRCDSSATLAKAYSQIYNGKS
ncbi:hypothetical protein TSUD_19030 [Trifolium subterraneum]|uniref:CCHC-type domain-containing protein n=2 Tax=Trifolium TaxID=3898 RepID=A0A2Z6MHC8_TRISU|nr:hypothetical protein TSUD_19030 [Trifolium subterraneum]